MRAVMMRTSRGGKVIGSGGGVVERALFQEGRRHCFLFRQWRMRIGFPRREGERVSSSVVNGLGNFNSPRRSGILREHALNFVRSPRLWSRPLRGCGRMPQSGNPRNVEIFAMIQQQRELVAGFMQLGHTTVSELYACLEICFHQPQVGQFRLCGTNGSVLEREPRDLIVPIGNYFVISICTRWLRRPASNS